MNESQQTLKRQITQGTLMLFTVMAIVATLFCTRSFAVGTGSDPNDTEQLQEQDSGALKFGLIAAATAFGLGAIGAGIAISHVGAAAMGAIAEKPEIAGRALIFVGLAEGLVVFGFITALMILSKV